MTCAQIIDINNDDTYSSLHKGLSHTICACVEKAPREREGVKFTCSGVRVRKCGS